MGNLLFVMGLGLAGIDPAGMVMLIPYLSHKDSKKKAVLFGLSIVCGVSLLGGTLSGLLASMVPAIEDMITSLEDRVWIGINLLVSLFLLSIGWNRIRKRGGKKSGKPEKGSGKGFWLVVGLNVILTLADPTFLSVVTLAGHKNNLFLSLFYAMVWIIISQSPLFLLIGAVLMGKHEAFISRFQSWRARHANTLSNLVTILIFICAGLLLLDVILYQVAGYWLIG